MLVQDFANDGAPSVRLGTIESLLKAERPANPIDSYRSSVKEMLTYGSVERLAKNDFLGRLLVLGLVSAAEGYIRSIMGACIEMCPVARTVASIKQIQLGGLLWHGKDGFSRSAFEHLSFAGKKDIMNGFREYLGILLEDGIFKGPLEQYESVCQIRHGIVHSDGFLPGRNAVLLDVRRFEQPVRIVIRFDELQEIAAVVNTLVYTLNRELFRTICQRWAIDWRKRADWEPRQEIALFQKVWGAFHCRTERRARGVRGKITRNRCMGVVRSHFRIV